VTLRCGLVGLPNSGKSTLFNALVSGTAAVASYPFCTIDPNVGIAAVPDPRLTRLHELFPTAGVVPATLEVVDIAGLVKGASQGEGLGNMFLSHIRNVDAVLHVVRGFVNDDIPHIYGEPDPLRDIELIEAELLLSDLDVLRKATDRVAKRAKGPDTAAQQELKQLQGWLAAAERGDVAALNVGARAEKSEMDPPMPPRPEPPAVIRELQLLSTKPVLYLLNVGEKETPRQAEWEKGLDALSHRRRARWLRFQGQLESELSALPPDERAPFLAELGLSEPGLAAVVREAYALLGLISFLTAGEKEVRAWPIPAGSTALDAAGKIHSDLQRGFIRAEVVDFATFSACGSMAAVREKGLLRSEGRDYVIKDGDVLVIRFNV
jgi:GTP-binding protein YchF